MEPNEKRSKSKSTRISLRRRTKLSSDEQSEGIGFHNQGTTIALTCVPKKCKKQFSKKSQNLIPTDNQRELELASTIRRSQLLPQFAEKSFSNGEIIWNQNTSSYEMYYILENNKARLQENNVDTTHPELDCRGSWQSIPDQQEEQLFI